jgi:hypothetical protein
MLVERADLVEAKLNRGLTFEQRDKHDELATLWLDF